MNSIVYFYLSTFFWLGILGLLAYAFTYALRPSMHSALLYRLIGWVIVFLAFVRKLGWATNEVVYRTLSGNSPLEIMDERIFWLVVSVGIFCLFVAWATQFAATKVD